MSDTCALFLGSTTSFTEALNKPSFLSEDELKQVILEVSFIGCFRVFG